MERPPQRPEPYVHPGVHPDVRGYAAGIAARRSGQLPKVTEPVAGGKAPPMPRLDGPAHMGVTMAQIAESERRASSPSGSIVDGPAETQAAAAPAFAPADMLPPQAAEDPAFRPGIGAMTAANNPHLALKYGIYRNGVFIPPQKLQPQRHQLSSKTLQGLEQLEELRRQQDAPEAPGLYGSDAEAERAATRGPAGAAATVGNAPGDRSSQPLKEEDRARARSAVEGMDEFEFDTFRQAMMRDILNNPEQKEIIEARLSPLDIGEMITTGSVRQTVPVIPGKLSFTFRSMSGHEDLELKRLVMEESKSLEVSDRYLLDKFALMSLTVGLVEVNGKPMGDVLNDQGEFDDDKFKVKFKRIIKLPLHMLASIGLNQLWFEQRARKLYVAEKVGNG